MIFVDFDEVEYLNSLTLLALRYFSSVIKFLKTAVVYLAFLNVFLRYFFDWFGALLSPKISKIPNRFNVLLYGNGLSTFLEDLNYSKLSLGSDY